MSHLLTRIVARKVFHFMTKGGLCAMPIITWQVSTEETASICPAWSDSSAANLCHEVWLICRIVSKQSFSQKAVCNRP